MVSNQIPAAASPLPPSAVGPAPAAAAANPGAATSRTDGPTTDKPHGPVATTAHPGGDDMVRLRENLKKVLKNLSEEMDTGGRQLSFSVDEALGRTVIKVHDTKSGDVVRQIPSEAVLKVAHTLNDLKGLMVDQHG